MKLVGASTESLSGEAVQNIITLVRYRQWYIPGNRASYKTLVSLGFPTTRIHEDSRGVLSLVLKKKNIQVEQKEFTDVLKNFQSQARKWWLSKPDREVRLNSKVMSFKTLKKSAHEDAKADMEKLRPKIEEFLLRWGFTGEIVYSENRGLCKLRVAFGLSSRLPIIKVKNPAQLAEKAILELGYHRLLCNTDKKFFHWWLEVKTGDVWRPITAGRCLLEMVTDPTDFISNLMIAFNKD